MKWYYAKRGKISQHGLVEDEVLKEMARKGELSHDDLLWSEPDGKSWMRASSVPGLCPEPEPEPEPEPDESEASSPTADTITSGGGDRVTSLESGTQSNKTLVVGVVVIGLVILVLAVLAGTGVLSSLFSKQPKPKDIGEIEPIGQPKETTKDWAKIAGEIEVLIKAYDASGAEELLNEMAKAVGESDIVNSLGARLTLLKQSLARLESLKKELHGGTMDEDKAADFIGLYAKYENGSRGLAEEIEDMADQRDLSAAACLSAVKVARLLNDDSLVRKLITTAADRSDSAVSWTICQDVLAECDVTGLDSSSMRVLRGFLASNPESSNAWFEKAARLCLQDEKEGALEALELAVKFGTDRVKSRAQKDKRFESLAKDRNFRRIIK